MGASESAQLRTARAELEAYSPTDPVISDVLQRTWSAIVELRAIEPLEKLTLLVMNPAVASADVLASAYFTENCLALRGEMTIVLNERFLLELEGAVRAFAQSESLLGTQYLKSDVQMFGLVRQMQHDPQKFVDRLRRTTARASADPAAEAQIRAELEMVTLFFLGHELGHLLSGHERGAFGAFVDPDEPLESRIDAAVVKLCRHVDEFNEAGFGLPGFQEVANPESGARQIAARYRARYEERYARQEAFFANEEGADEWANRIVIEYLERRSTNDELEGRRSVYLVSRGIFVAALYSWYRDLDAFGNKMEPGTLNDATNLYVTMMKSRAQYIHAASLFGDLHRFTLLRAAKALEAIIRARTDWLDQPAETRSIHSSHAELPPATDPEGRRQWWLSEALRRYVLLCISMDTAVKLANVGCATGWITDMDRKRGTPQLFVMNFEPIGAAVQRLRGLR